VAILSPLEGDKDKFQENVNIVVQDLGGQEITTEQYAEVTKQSLGQVITDLKIASGDLVLADDGSEVYLLEYSGVQAGSDVLNWKQAFTISGGKAYILTYTAEAANADAFAEEVEAIADSWIVNP
jgi:hypothetical protein